MADWDGYMDEIKSSVDCIEEIIDRMFTEDDPNKRSELAEKAKDPLHKLLVRTSNMTRVLNRETGGRAAKCWFCGEKLVWDCDYTLEDMGEVGEGIVSTLHCPNPECKASAEFAVRYDEE